MGQRGNGLSQDTLLDDPFSARRLRRSFGAAPKIFAVPGKLPGNFWGSLGRFRKVSGSLRDKTCLNLKTPPCAAPQRFRTLHRVHISGTEKQPKERVFWAESLADVQAYPGGCPGPKTFSQSLGVMLGQGCLRALFWRTIYFHLKWV